MQERHFRMIFPEWEGMAEGARTVARRTAEWVEEHHMELCLEREDIPLDGDTLTAIDSVVREEYSFGLAELMAERTRKHRIVELRYIIFDYYSARNPEIPLLKMEAIFGYDHATILHALERVAEWRATDPKFRKLRMELIRKFDIKRYLNANKETDCPQG